MFHGRSTLVIVDTKQKLISIFDSHYHENFGAMIAFSNYEKLEKFCDLVIDQFFPETKSGENLDFEITLLQLTQIPNNLPWFKKVLGFRTNGFENVEKCMKEI
uniref:Uncharacterized protein n=1 Tax=Panagrolaimus davidi TaxID=227884 RepID=A0A914PEC2_9BILA